MSGEKTEQPTDKRLRDAREKGDIAKSTEVVSAAVVLAVIAFFIASSDSVFSSLAAAVSYALENAARLPYEEAVRLIGAVVVGCALSIVFPVVALVICAALLALLPQTGFLIAPKAAIPKIENLNPAKWFKKVFSKNNLFEFVKNIIKVVVLSVAVYRACSNHVREIFMLMRGDIGSMWRVAGSLFFDMAVYAIAAFGILAALDFVYNKFKYNKEHMMSRQEVKDEFKQSEGDPHIKQKRRQLHQEMANQNTVGKTRKAKVVIVNPTHYAVAIDYDKDRTKLPVVLAKGQGELARRMIEAAKEENIPIMRQPELARALYADAHEDEYVPSDLLLQVAEVLRIIAAAKDHGR